MFNIKHTSVFMYKAATDRYFTSDGFGEVNVI